MALEGGLPLADFETPPVIEVVLSLQFEALSTLQAVQLGALWEEFKEDFPRTEEHTPLPPVVETFGLPPRSAQVQFKMVDRPEPPRVWMLDAEGSRLIQIQQDRLIQNWRRMEEGSIYPHYGILREGFEVTLSRFRQFVDRQELGPIRPNQCEVSYINHILPSGVWSNHGEADKVFGLARRVSGDFLPDLEEIQIASRFVIGGSQNPAGRLHAQLQPAFRTTDTLPIFVLTLTARGAPTSTDDEGILRFFDLGHEWIVRGFAELTTPRMHQVWGRIR